MTLSVQSDGGGDYTTLAAALSNASSGEVINIEETWASADTTNHTISQAQTINCIGDAKHPGHPNNGSASHWRSRVTSGHAFTLSAAVTLDGLDVGSQSTTTSDECVRLNANSTTFEVKNCLLWHNISDDGSPSQMDCIYFNNIDGSTLNLTNSMLWGACRSGVGIYDSDGTTTININSSSIYGVGSGGELRAGCIGVSGTIGPVNVNAFNSMLHEDDYYGTYPVVSIEDTGDLNAAVFDRCITNEANFGYATKTTETDCEVSKTFNDSASSGTVTFNDITGDVDTYDLRLTDDDLNLAKNLHSDSSGAGLSMPATDILGTTRAAAYECGAFEIAAAGGATVDATSESLVLTEYPANISLDINVSATSESLTLTEYSTTVSQDIDVSATSETLVLTEYPADVVVATNLQAGTDSLVITEYPATVSLAIDVQATSESLTLTEYNPTVDVSVATNVEATSEALTLTEYPANVALDLDVQATSESLVITEYNATVSVTVETIVNATSEALTLTEYPATVVLGINVQATSEALTLTEYPANVALDTSVEATSEALTLTEYAASIISATNVSAAVDALILTEYAATVTVAASDWTNITIQGINTISGEFVRIQGQYKLT